MLKSLKVRFIEVPFAKLSSQFSLNLVPVIKKGSQHLEDWVDGQMGRLFNQPVEAEIETKT